MSEFAIRCFIGTRRVLTHKLSRQQAENFHLAAQHLSAYLEDAYRIGGKRKRRPPPLPAPPPAPPSVPVDVIDRGTGKVIGQLKR